MPEAFGALLGGTHERRSYLDLAGFHAFIRQRVAEREQADTAFCQITERHWYQGRFSLAFTRESDPERAPSRIERDRLQDERLTAAGIVAHYYPMNAKDRQKPHEKGVDVFLSLDAFDLATRGRFDVLAIITGDEDYVPLVRKVNAIGPRVMIIGMEAEWTGGGRNGHWINTSQCLLNESSYPVLLNQETDSRTAKTDACVQGLFKSNRLAAA